MSGGREDFREILRLVRPGTRVLDIGCGEGVLLEMMAQEKNIDGRGLEISPSGVAACLTRGLAVVQGDADLQRTTRRLEPFLVAMDVGDNVIVLDHFRKLF